jgi:hypothetical protein
MRLELVRRLGPKSRFSLRRIAGTGSRNRAHPQYR